MLKQCETGDIIITGMKSVSFPKSPQAAQLSEQNVVSPGDLIQQPYILPHLKFFFIFENFVE